MYKYIYIYVYLYMCMHIWQKVSNPLFFLETFLKTLPFSDFLLPPPHHFYSSCGFVSLPNRIMSNVLIYLMKSSF